MTVDRAELRRLAEAATPVAAIGYQGIMTWSLQTPRSVGPYLAYVMGSTANVSLADLRHIAANDPATVLAREDRIDQLERILNDVAQTDCQRKDWSDFYPCPTQYDDLEQFCPTCFVRAEWDGAS